MKCFINFYKPSINEGFYCSADRLLAYMASKATLAEVSFNVAVQSKALLA